MEQISLNNNYSNILNAVLPIMMQPFSYMTKENTPSVKQNINEVLLDAFLDAIKNVSPKPKWFDPTIAVEQWRKIIDGYDDSPSVITTMKEIHNIYSDSSDNETMIFMRACRQIYKHLNKSYSVWQESSMSEFLHSDLPFHLYNTYTMSYISKVAAVKQMEKIAKSFRASMITTGNNHICKYYQNEIAKINDQIALSVKYELAMRLFLKCISENKMQNLFNGNNGIIVGWHMKEFNKRFTKFEQSVFKLMQTLNIDQSVYTSIIENISGVKKFQNLLYNGWYNNDTK